MAQHSRARRLDWSVCPGLRQAWNSNFHDISKRSVLLLPQNREQSVGNCGDAPSVSSDAAERDSDFEGLYDADEVPSAAPLVPVTYVSAEYRPVRVVARLSELPPIRPTCAARSCGPPRV